MASPDVNPTVFLSVAVGTLIGHMDKTHPDEIFTTSLLFISLFTLTCSIVLIGLGYLRLTQVYNNNNNNNNIIQYHMITLII